MSTLCFVGVVRVITKAVINWTERYVLWWRLAGCPIMYILKRWDNS